MARGNGKTGDDDDRIVPDAKIEAARLDAIDKLVAEVVPLDWTKLGSYKVPPDLVDGWLPRGVATLFAGDGGVFKTWTALALAFHLASGGPVLGNKAGAFTGRTLFLSMEDMQARLARRLKLLGEAFNLSRKALGALNQRMLVLSTSERDLDEQALMAQERDSAPSLTVGHGALERWMEACKPDLLVIDNAVMALLGNLNDAALVTRFVKAMGRLAEQHGCAVLLLAHVAKNSTSGYFGSVAWHNAARARWLAERMTEAEGPFMPGDVRLRLEKANEAQTGATLRVWWPKGAALPSIGNVDNTVAGRVLAEKAREGEDAEAVLPLALKLLAEGGVWVLDKPGTGRRSMPAEVARKAGWVSRLNRNTSEARYRAERALRALVGQGRLRIARDVREREFLAAPEAGP